MAANRGTAATSVSCFRPSRLTASSSCTPSDARTAGPPLPEVRDANATRYQVTEMPPIRPHTTEYRGNGVTCGCGYTTFAKTEGVVPSSPFGPRLRALIALLTGVYHLSRRRVVTLLQVSSACRFP